MSLYKLYFSSSLSDFLLSDSISTGGLSVIGWICIKSACSSDITVSVDSLGSPNCNKIRLLKQKPIPHKIHCTVILRKRNCKTILDIL